MQFARVLARQEELARENATSQNALDDARAADAVARADLQAARTLVRSFGGGEGGGSARVAVRAPIEGTVAERFTALGSPVTPDKPLFHLIAASQVYVLAKLPETAARLPAAGDAVTLWPRGGESCAGQVVQVLDVVDSEHRRGVRIAPAGACRGLVAGRYVDTALGEGTEAPAGLVVPRDAVVDVRGAETVFVQGADGRFLPRSVRIGIRTPSERVVDEGLSAGERVAVTGVVLLKGEVLRSELAP